MSNYAKNFSFNLKFYRQERKFTQKNFAELLGYSEKTVSKWECGASIPGIETLFDISNTLHISIETLFGDRKIYCLGIDGGGTKTKLALSDAEGAIIRTLKADSCNPVDIGLDAAKKILRDAVYEICKDIPLSSVYTFAGIAGGTTSDMQKKLKDFFSKFGFCTFLNDSDNKNIIAAGLDRDDGITVILGTGVCVFAQRNNVHKRISGWGYLIDNGGSGYNLGCDSLRAYFSAIDGTGAETILTEEIDKIYPGGTQKLMNYIYSGGKKAIASFAPAIFRALEKGDKIADHILRRNMAEAAHLIETAARDFKMEQIPVILAGGLSKQSYVIEYLKNALQNCGRYDIRILDRDPVYGALMIAQQLIIRKDENNAKDRNEKH